MQSVQRFGVPEEAAQKQNIHLAAGPTHCGVDYSPVLPFLLALSATDETTKATQQTNTPAHGPEDNFLFPAASKGPSLDFPDDFYNSCWFLLNSFYFDGVGVK